MLVFWIFYDDAYISVAVFKSYFGANCLKNDGENQIKRKKIKSQLKLIKQYVTFKRIASVRDK